ncbi:MAG: TIGR03905 family TSCPD domain-containing protein [Clostridiales bacterium]|nr:TIGR03905 family TSCPD domain-containing protein [Clostridiales bacterium]
MSKFSYTPQGVCSVQIDFEIDGDTVHNVKFTRGCNGNTQGIARLVDGMKVDEVIARLKGLNCNGRGTSCPDQLAAALELAKEQM